MNAYTRPDAINPQATLRGMLQAAATPPKAVPWWQMISVCTVRATKSYWRQPAYSVVRMLLAAAIALCFGSVYGPERQVTHNDSLSRPACAGSEWRRIWRPEGETSDSNTTAMWGGRTRAASS